MYVSDVYVWNFGMKFFLGGGGGGGECETLENSKFQKRVKW